MGEYPPVDITEGSIHLLATNYVSHKWKHDRGMAKITRVGVHYFYRWEIHLVIKTLTPENFRDKPTPREVLRL